MERSTLAAEHSGVGGKGERDLLGDIERYAARAKEGVHQAAARREASVGLTQRTRCTLPSSSLASQRSQRLMNSLY
jgi:hypothetical protein